MKVFSIKILIFFEKFFKKSKIKNKIKLNTFLILDLSLSAITKKYVPIITGKLYTISPFVAKKYLLNEEIKTEYNIAAKKPAFLFPIANPIKIKKSDVKNTINDVAIWTRV